jgi:ornithine decarboxylase
MQQLRGSAVQDTHRWDNARAHLVDSAPDHPVLYFSPDRLWRRAKRFLSGFPGRVTYAVKANDRPEVLDVLAQAGVTGFDVASPAEMRAARRALPQARLNYHNPVRSADEIAAGLDMGVQSWSVDDAAGLAALDGADRAADIAVRFTLPLKGGAYDFGAKFGASPDEAAELLRQASGMGFGAALTFHPGTQCERPEAWGAYIDAAAGIARQAGVPLRCLNVGGGFPAARAGGDIGHDDIFALIADAAAKAFGTPPDLVCEPGRAMVADAFVLATRIKALRRGNALALNDGIYGGLADLRDMPAPGRLDVIAPDGTPRTGAPVQRMLFGPTCDSLDVLPGAVPLPGDAQPGDYVIWPAMGAYSVAMSTRFNGYGLSEVVAVRDLDG